jgi:hypothetical protein
MGIEKLQSLLADTSIKVVSISSHSKATELYIEVLFKDLENVIDWEGLIPYYYRRTGLLIETEEELAIYLKQILPFFRKSLITAWVESEQKYWAEELENKKVTKPFFDILTKLKWVSSFPANPNPQRKLQDIILKQHWFVKVTRVESLKIK